MRFAWTWISLLALTGLAPLTLAQGPTPQPQRPAQSIPGVQPQTPPTPPGIPTRPERDPFALSLSGPVQRGLQTNLSAAGSGSTTSTGMNGDVFTAAQAEPAIPTDRVSLEFGYFDQFRVQDQAGTRPGYDLTRYQFTVEKTFLDGRASVVFHLPVLDSFNTLTNVTNRSVDGLGDLTAGLKVLLFGDPAGGFVLSGGLLVAAPTQRDQLITPLLAPPGTPTGTTINPTYFLPFVCGLFQRDRFFAQNYLGLVIPDDDRASTLINNNLTLGYQLYHCDSSQFVTSVTPTVGAQALIVLSETNGLVVTPDQVVQSAGLSDQVFIRGGALVGFGERTMLSANVITPVVGPRAFSVGASVSLTYFFGRPYGGDACPACSTF